jgi:pimeloyl-ACP methyl ester carboxylesterase
MRRIAMCLMLLTIVGCDGEGPVAKMVAEQFPEALTLLSRGPDLAAGGEGDLVNLSEPGIDPQAPFDPTKPTIVITHGLNALNILGPRVRYEYPFVMCEAIRQRCPDAYNLAAWDWNRAPLEGTDVLSVIDNAIHQGKMLAQAMLERNVGIEVQLIGHSLGCTLITAAAKELGGVTQLTLMEPTFTIDDLLLVGLDAPAYAEEVENYWALPPTGFGRPVDDGRIFNRLVTEMPSTRVPVIFIAPIRNHVNVMLYYLDTINDPSLPDGFNRSAFVDRCEP